MYVFLSPTLSCVVSFLSLYTCFLLFVFNLLFLFHTKMPWWVLFKVFQKYRLSKSTCHKLSSCKVSRVLFIVFNKWIWVEWFMTSLICSFVYCGFVMDCQMGWLLGHMCFSCYKTYVMILGYWFILWQNALYLYLGRLRMCLTTSRNHVSRSSVEAFKSVQEIKQECKFIKATAG